MGMQKGRSKVTADLKNNRLTIELRGKVSKSEVERIYTDIRFCAGDLKQGFDVITDMRNCQIGYLAGALTFKRIMEFLLANGVRRVVRITGKSKPFLHQVSRITSSITGYQPIYVISYEEAESVLAESSEAIDMA